MEKTAGGVGLGRRTKGSLGCVASSIPVIHLREDVAGQFDVGIWCLEKRSGLKMCIWELLAYREY